jgi:hypothetical protein
MRTFCKCFRRVLQVSRLFRTYAASVSFGCCNNRSGVAHVAMGPTYRCRLLQLLGTAHVEWGRRWSPHARRKRSWSGRFPCASGQHEQGDADAQNERGAGNWEVRYTSRRGRPDAHVCSDVQMLGSISPRNKDKLLAWYHQRVQCAHPNKARLVSVTETILLKANNWKDQWSILFGIVSKYKRCISKQVSIFCHLSPNHLPHHSLDVCLNMYGAHSNGCHIRDALLTLSVCSDAMLPGPMRYRPNNTFSL